MSDKTTAESLGPDPLRTSAEPPARTLTSAGGPELVIGLVTPIGTNTSSVAERIRTALAKWNYRSHTVRISEYFDAIHGGAPPGEFEDERVGRLIGVGNDWCQRHNDAAACAYLAVLQIRVARKALNRARGLSGTEAELLSTPVPRQAYVIHSLKRVAEVQVLSQLYGTQFLLVGCQAKFEDRLETIASRALSVSDEDSKRAVARALIDLDGSENNPMGQKVNETFPQSDYFLGVNESAERFVDLVFGDPRRPPTSGELAMYLAQATSVQSLSASRRVGAALVAENDVIAVGCNDVPPGEEPDVLVGKDTSEQFKRDLLQDTLRRLRDGNWLAPDKAALALTVLVDEALELLENSQLMSVIEYQRPVHAEVAAISNAARRGQRVSGTALYCTTFPCHLCFKALLAAGVETVYYIHPYPKSRAQEMYPHSRQRLTPYEGIAPSSYMSLFEERPVLKADEAGVYPTVNYEIWQPIISPDRTPEEIAADEANRIARLKLDGEHQDDR